MTWTHFWDMYSGGGRKLEWELIFIEAPEDEACAAFELLFKRDPHHVTCNCCGSDYSVSESDDLAQATGFHRGCRYDTQAQRYVEEPNGRSHSYAYKTVAEYERSPGVLFVRRIQGTTLPRSLKELTAGEAAP